MSKKNPVCDKCNFKFVYDPSTKGYHEHPDEYCVKNQLALAKAEIEKLKIEIASWKNSWYEQRTATGEQAWTVPNPWYLQNIKSDFFQHQWNQFIKFGKELLSRGFLTELDNGSESDTLEGSEGSDQP